MPARVALVLEGGGARGAYQAGVLKALRELLPTVQAIPFPLICAVSGGAINGALLAAGAADFGSAVERLLAFWDGIVPAQVWRSRSAWRRWLSKGGPLLDNAPLARILAEKIDFDAITAAIEQRHLTALSLDCFGHASGQTVSFFQGRGDIDPWQAGDSAGAHVRLGLEHVLASSALPLFFPPQHLHREFFGDGVLGGRSPIRAARQLGAGRILRIETEFPASAPGRMGEAHPPGFACMAGHALNRLYRSARGEDGPLATLTLAPSMDPTPLAALHLATMPPFSGWDAGSNPTAGALLASYLLFDKGYGKALTDLGYHDAMERRTELIDLFSDSSALALG